MPASIRSRISSWPERASGCSSPPTLVAGWGTQWDIQWHLRIGRDSFWIPPHLMTYSGVTVLVLVSFGVLAWTSARALGGADRQPGMVRVIGVTGTRGYHLAAWGIALTVLAAPIDDLWHRLFGLDVTLWSPPHLLGLLGGLINAGACWLIAQEAYPKDSRARLAAIVLAGALVYAGIGLASSRGSGSPTSTAASGSSRIRSSRRSWCRWPWW